MHKLILLLAATSAGADPLLFAGSGGCDASDLGCTDQTSELWSFSATPAAGGGSLVPAAFAPLEKLYLGGGQPSWTKVAGKCLFVTITNSHQVISFRVLPNSSIAQKSNISLAPALNPVFIDTLADWLLVANYHGPDTTTVEAGAGISVLKVEPDCSLTLKPEHYVPCPRPGAPSRSVDPGRQGASHIHSVNALPGSTTRVFACDLGTDTITTFDVDPKTGKTTETASLLTTPGSGPRHMAFHPSARKAYVIFEMGNFVAVYDIADADGALTETQRVTTLPGRSEFSGYSKAAEILITPDGRQLLASNRGYGADSGSVVVYRLSEKGDIDGIPVSTPVGDQYPRGISLMPAASDNKDTAVVLVAGQSGSRMSAFSVKTNGSLISTGLNFAGPAHPTTVSFAIV
jgi:6-phosphogluconolactonase (cycloisomerase 2 family)